MKKKQNYSILPLLIMGLFLVLSSSCEKINDDIEIGDNTEHEFGEMTDSRDGKRYKTIQIGDQEWMAENLAYAPSSQNYWAYNNDDANLEFYGYLYDWQTAMDVCPEGWHLPSNEEWSELIDYLGENVGGKLKATGTIEAGTGLWRDSYAKTTNETGFSALPGGLRLYNGGFNHIGLGGFWWSATEDNTYYAWCQHMSYLYSNVFRRNYGKELGCSVRCVKD
jgi:uncharacterized protein (TIGR02145 family)